MEKQKRILLADEDREFINTMKKYLIKEYAVDDAVGGEEAKAKIEKNTYEIIVMDVMLSKIDGYELLETIKEKDNKPKVIVASNIYGNSFIQKALNMGVNYYMIKPITAEVLSSRIKDILSDTSEDVPLMVKGIDTKKAKHIEEKITNIFITVGIPAHIKGYHFLREAIKMAIDNPDVINSITKKLYPSIADRFSTSSSKVERAIRHAIEVAWNRGKIENINAIFGIKVYSSSEKPTNGEFIALVADKMLMEG